MLNMTPGQQREFIKMRVQDIMNARTELAEKLSDMNQIERDTYVHRRIEDDLAVEMDLVDRVNRYVELRQWMWRSIVALDIVALVGLSAVVILIVEREHSLPVFISLGGIVCAMLFSRIINSQLIKRAEVIQRAMVKHLAGSTSSATLDFLVDGLNGVNGHGHAEAEAGGGDQAGQGRVREPERGNRDIPGGGAAPASK
jgi:hypothetical protein